MPCYCEQASEKGLCGAAGSIGEDHSHLCLTYNTSAQPRSLAGIGAVHKRRLAKREYKLSIMPSTSAVWDSQPLNLSSHGGR
jgi:hypothetical protein